MIVFPTCKINLGLRILRKREDGYHDLDTVFYPVPVCDVLEVLPTADSKADISFKQTGYSLPGDVENNSCVKAYHLVKNLFPTLPGVSVHLHKIIPPGAGLGGGSADAVFMLRALQQLFSLEIPSSTLQDLSLTLGSDCPFFLLNSAANAAGRGEILSSLPLSLSTYAIYLINPGIHISTPAAFKACAPSLAGEAVASTLQRPISTWKTFLKNQFEEGIFAQYPILASIKEELYNQGAIYASMSGSGSTMYGIFPTSAPQPSPFFDQFPWTKWVKLS
jgi:4-diphosphocytidyl-2-C-methyl-D-erythritol kinase